jgi:hypothetical protein
MLLEGRQQLEVPAVDAVAGARVDLLTVTTNQPSFDLDLTLRDKGGRVLSLYQRTVRVVPPQLLGQAS